MHENDLEISDKVEIRRAFPIPETLPDHERSPGYKKTTAWWVECYTDELKEIENQLCLPQYGLYFFHNGKVYISGGTKWYRLGYIQPEKSGDFKYLIGGSWWEIDQQKEIDQAANKIKQSGKWKGDTIDENRGEIAAQLLVQADAYRPESEPAILPIAAAKAKEIGLE